MRSVWLYKELEARLAYVILGLLNKIHELSRRKILPSTKVNGEADNGLGTTDVPRFVPSDTSQVAATRLWPWPTHISDQTKTIRDAARNCGK